MPNGSNMDWHVALGETVVVLFDVVDTKTDNVGVDIKFIKKRPKLPTTKKPVVALE